MSHHRSPSPSFFKILLDPSAPHLPLPVDFVTKHLNNKIPKSPIIKSSVGGYSWRLKIKRVGESYCFCDGWDCVVDDANLGFGDFLIFRFDGGSVFELLVYGANGCEKDLPQKVESDSDVVVDDDDDDDDDLEIKEKDETEEEEEEEEEEDEIEDEYESDDDDDDDDDEEGEELKYEELNEDDDDDDDGEDDGGIDGDDGDPYFVVTISQTHRNVLRLPEDFTELAGINGKETLILKNLDGEEWATGLRLEVCHSSERVCVSSGWSAFWRSNHLSEGDECVFTYIRDEDRLLLARVTKKRRAAKQPQHSGNAPVNEVVKGKKDGGKKDSGEVPVNQVVNRKKDAGEAPANECVNKKKDGVKKDSGEVPVVEVEKRKRGRPARKVRVKKSGGTPASEGKKRREQPRRNRNTGGVPAVEKRRGRPAREDGGGGKPSGESPARKIINRKKEQPERKSGRVPASELKKKRGRPAREDGGVKPSGESPSRKVVKRKREQPERKSGKVPATKGGKRKRGMAAREDGDGGVEVVVKRPRGRPRKRQRGMPAKQK